MGFPPSSKQDLKGHLIFTKNCTLKGGWHDFQYFDHKSNWYLDLWENVQKLDGVGPVDNRPSPD